MRESRRPCVGAAALLASLVTALAALAPCAPFAARAARAADAAESIPARPSAGCARASLERGERIERTLEIDGVARTFVLDAPEALAPGRPVPLLLDFHGIGHSGAGVWSVSGFRALARRTPFLTAYPDGLPVRLETPTRVFEGVGWEVRTIAGNRELAFVGRLLDALESEYCIDLARVYATGFSNGGYLSHLLGCAMPDRIAAIAPVSGGVLGIRCEPSRAVPVLIHHGRRDELVEVVQARRARDAWLRIDACDIDGAPSPPIAPGASPAPPAPNPSRAPVDGARDGVPDAASMSDGITCTTATRCRDGAVVEYCEGDFGHRWPSSATERIWKFLLAHPLPAAPG